MNKKIRLTESELVELIERIVREQKHNEESEAFQHYAYGFEDVIRDFFMGGHDDLTEEDIDIALDNLAQILDYAEADDNVSDDEFEQLYDLHDEMAREIHMKFDILNGLNEGTKAKKPRAMRSRRSGIKKVEQLKNNYKVLNKIVKEQIEMDDEEDDDEEIEMQPSFARQLRHSEPDEFTLVGKIQRNRFRSQFREKNYAHFVLRTKNKTEDGTGILGGGELEDYEDKVVKITGITKDGNPPSFKNPIKLTKRPHVLSR